MGRWMNRVHFQISLFHTMNEQRTNRAIRASSNFLSSKILLVYRTLVALFSTFFFFFSLSIYPAHFFRFLTNWSWLGLTLYFLLAAYISWYHSRSNYRSAITPYATIFDMLFHSAATFALVVTVIYWGLLSIDYYSKTTVQGQFTSLTPHAFNTVFIILELLLSKNEFSRLGFLWPILWIVLYNVLSAILRVTGTPWPYFFLEVIYSGPIWGVFVAFLVSFAFIILLYFFLSLLALIRDYFGRAKPKTSNDIESPRSEENLANVM